VPCPSDPHPVPEFPNPRIPHCNATTLDANLVSTSKWKFRNSPCLHIPLLIQFPIMFLLPTPSHRISSRARIALCKLVRRHDRFIKDFTQNELRGILGSPNSLMHCPWILKGLLSLEFAKECVLQSIIFLQQTVRLIIF